MRQAGTMAPPYHLKLYVYYFSQSSDTHYSVRGGHSGNGFYCGFTFVHLIRGSGFASWGVGAALSFKPLLFYCDYFYQNSGTRYAFRGGYCNIGFDCGFAFAGLSYSTAVANWNLGAALSFKPSFLL